MTESMSEDARRAYHDGQVNARLQGHDEHFVRINGSLEANVLAITKLDKTLTGLADELRVDALQRSTTALQEASANAARMKALEIQQQTLSERWISPEAIQQIIAESLREKEARGWTGRERMMGVVLCLLTVGSFFLNLYALH